MTRVAADAEDNRRFRAPPVRRMLGALGLVVALVLLTFVVDINDIVDIDDVRYRAADGASEDDECDATAGNATARPCKWWPTPHATELRMTCVYSASYPDVAKEKGALFDSKAECCERYCTESMGYLTAPLRPKLTCNMTEANVTIAMNEALANDRNRTGGEDAWLPSRVPPGTTCRDCTPSGLRWTGIPREPCPCDFLSGKRVIFMGDSYVRHAYVAFVLWLSGDYDRGSLKPDADEVCRGEGQFEEKICRSQIRLRIRVPCGAEVHLKNGNWPSLKPVLSSYDFIVWGGGNHPVDLDYKRRIGVNDANVSRSAFIRPGCEGLPRSKVAERVVFLLTHARWAGGRREDRGTLRKFHDEVPRPLFEECGVTRMASAFDATEALVDRHGGDARNMTWDGNHWGGAMNAYKAYAIFNAMKGTGEVSSSDSALNRTNNVEKIGNKTEPISADAHERNVQKSDEDATSCRRPCPQRINKIYFEHRPAGLQDRYSIIGTLVNLAGYLCAVVELPPPHTLISAAHNRGQEINKKLLWTDFRNMTFLDDGSPALKDALMASNFPLGFDHDSNNWRRQSVYPTDEYQGWLRLSSGNLMEHYRQTQDYSWRQPDNATVGFIWEMHRVNWYADELYKTRVLPEPSREVINNVASKYRSEMRPKTCSYVRSETPRKLASLQERLKQRIQSLSPQNTSVYGGFHVRRGDSVKENSCDTSLEGLRDYLLCSINGTGSTGHHLTLLLCSDEQDEAFRQDVVRLVSDLPHVSMLDADKITNETMNEWLEEGLLPHPLANNYYQFELMSILRGPGKSSLASVSLKRDRSGCPVCTPLVKTHPSVWVL